MDDAVDLDDPVAATDDEARIGLHSSLDPEALRRGGNICLFNRKSVKLRTGIASEAQKAYGWQSAKSSTNVRRQSTLGDQRRSSNVDLTVGYLTQAEPLTLNFRDVEVERELGFIMGAFHAVLQHVPYFKRYAVKDKKLMTNASGSVKPGQLCAIVGPSGAGKTTILNCLSGRSPHKVTGDVYVTDSEGKSISVFSRERLARTFGPGAISYVYENDALFPNLTVRESLRYAAWFRLPSSTSFAHKNARVDQVLELLGLYSVRNSKIGSQQYPILSGGEKRRVSIGHELVTNPSILFFDEPTSGLDSASAHRIVELCAAMARAGNRTVLMVIHQPTGAMLELFDVIIVVSKGSIVYRGEAHHLSSYMASIGHSVPPGTNPLEFTLEVVKYYEENDDTHDILPGKFREYMARGGSESDAPPARDDESFGKKLGRFCLSPLQWCGFTRGSLYATTVFEQFAFLCHRNIYNNFRTREVLFVRLGVMIALSLCVGSLFALRDECEVRDVAALLLLGVASVVFNSLESLPVYCRERLIFIRETLSNSYHPLVYSLSHFLVHIPFLGFLALVYSAGSYWLAGLTIGAVEYIYYNLVIWGSLATGQALVVMTSTATADVQIGNAIVTAFFALMFYFGGFFLRRTEMPVYWEWFHYLSIFKYPFEGLLLMNYDHDFTCDCPCPTTIFTGNKTYTVQPHCKYSQETIINEFDIEITSPWVHLLILVCYCVFFRLLSYCFLQLSSRR